MAKDSHNRAHERELKTKRYLHCQVHFCDWKDVLFRIYLSKKAYQGSASYGKKEFWRLQEDTVQDQQEYQKRRLDRGRWNQNYGAKGAKQKYHKLRRRQASKLCHYALMEDWKRFDSIAPDGFMGAIGWDIL